MVRAGYLYGYKIGDVTYACVNKGNATIGTGAKTEVTLVDDLIG